MARPTVEQRDALAGLRATHGEPETISIEVTSGAYGVMRCVWVADPVFAVSARTILVRPDGTRLCWRSIAYKGEAGEVLEVHVFPAATPIRRRTIWRYRILRLRFRLRHGRGALALVDEANREFERQVFFGQGLRP